MNFNPHSDPVAREVHDVNAQLGGIRDQLWEMNQPPEVRAALQAERAKKAQVMVWGVRVVLGLALVWVVLTKLFGAAGSRFFGGMLAFAWNAFEVVLVLGFFLLIGQTLWRGLRWLAGRPGAPSVGGDQ